MLPSLPLSDNPDSAKSDAKHDSDSSKRTASSIVKSTNLPHVILDKNGRCNTLSTRSESARRLGMLRTTGYATTRRPIIRIHLPRSLPKMSRITARWVVAGMENKRSGPNRASGKPEHDAMSAHGATSKPGLPVAVLIESTPPRPTFVRTTPINLGPKHPHPVSFITESGHKRKATRQSKCADGPSGGSPKSKVSAVLAQPKRQNRSNAANQFNS